MNCFYKRVYSPINLLFLLMDKIYSWPVHYTNNLSLVRIDLRL